MTVTLEDLRWAALTIFLEAESEPPQGQLGVAYVIRNRLATAAIPRVAAVVLAAYQFACWGDPRAAGRLARCGGDPPESALKLAAAALFGLVPDPTDASDAYLNVPLTLATRTDHRLPAWAADPTDPTRPDPAKVRATIGAHTFLRLGGP